MTAWLKKYAPIILLLLLATYTRWHDVGREPPGTDGVQIGLMAVNVAHGQITFTGPPMSAGTSHSPFTIYLYALPFLLKPDYRLAVIFTGALNVAAIALTYVLAARYFSRPAGLIAAALYAVHPEAIFISRQVLNTVLGPPFVMAYLFTGLLGFYEGKKWPRLLHLPLLSLAVQCHPQTIFLAPITLALAAYGLRLHPAQGKQIISQTVVGGAVAALLFIPWGIGVYQQIGGQSDPASAFNLMTNRGPRYAVEQTIGFIGSWEETIAKKILPPLVAIGMVWLVLRALRRREAFPGLVVVLAFILIPAVALLINIKYRDTYSWPVSGAIFLIEGALLGGVFNRGKIGSFLAPLWNWRGLAPTPYFGWLTVVIVPLIFFTHFRFFYSYDPSGGRAATDDYIAAIRLATRDAAKTGRAALILIPYDDGDHHYDYMTWEMMNEGQPARVIWGGRGLPLPQNGAVLIGPADYDGRPFIFSGGGIVYDHFRLADLPPADHFNPDLAPLQPIRLANGSTLFGFLRETPDSLPSASQPWTIFLIWRVDTPGGEDYKIFVHLINDRGDKYAQLDVPGLPVGQQRAGELVMSQLDFQMGGGPPPAGPLFLRFGMYNSAGQTQLLDESGNAAGDYGVIQIRGQSAPLAVWDNGLSLDDLTMADPQVQGPPLVVSATWHTAQQPSADLRARWRLLGADGAPVFVTITDVVEGKTTAALPAGVFANARYSLRLPTDVSAGGYTLELQLVDNNGKMAGEPYRSAIEIAARDRNFEPPPMPHVVNATFGQAIKLLGYDLEQSGRTLQLVLNWRALGQIARDYKYFLHVWREGQVVAQVDSVPGNYQYYTSWWAPNEVFSETIALDLASLDAGTYTLTTGFYDPANGERLPVLLSNGTRSGDEWVTLEDITLK